MTATAYKRPPQLSLAQAWTWFKDPFPNLAGSAKTAPELLAVNILHVRAYLLNHPEMVQHVLLKNYQNYRKDHNIDILALVLGNGLLTNNDHASWRKQRVLMQPAFHHKSLQTISQVVVASANSMLQHWKTKEGETINFTNEMARLTINIVAKALFTADVSEEVINTIWQSMDFLNGAIERRGRYPIKVPLWINTPHHVKWKKCTIELDRIIYDLIKKRRENPNPPYDLLQMLITARFENTGQGMTDEQIRDEVIIIFAAGHETTVNALSWTWMLLKQNVAEEAKLKDESKPLAEKGDPAFNDVPAMVYGKQLLNEAMRLYPPVQGTGREAIADDEILGYHIPAGKHLAINIAGVHRHPDFWSQPDTFQPQRFEEFEAKGLNRFSFMPFGGGPRICIGNSFAMMEMQLINAMLASRVHMELISTEIKAVCKITLQPGDGVIMKLNKVRL